MTLADRFARSLPRLWRAANTLRLEVETPLLRGGAIDRGLPAAGQIALTFDDGPDPRFTPRVLEALERTGARATFFMIGKSLEQHPELARAVAARHQVGTHLYSHRRDGTWRLASFHTELEAALAAHRRVLGVEPTALRFPFGTAGRVRARDLRPRGLTVYHWTFSAIDWRAFSDGEIRDRVLPRLSAGAIVLFHDGRAPNATAGPEHREPTIAALPAILDEIARLGLKPVTLDELAVAHRS